MFPGVVEMGNLLRGVEGIPQPNFRRRRAVWGTYATSPVEDVAMAPVGTGVAFKSCFDASGRYFTNIVLKPLAATRSREPSLVH